jgi:hypothetical protein
MKEQDVRQSFLCNLSEFEDSYTPNFKFTISLLNPDVSAAYYLQIL